MKASLLSKFKIHLEEPEEDLPQLTINTFDLIIMRWKNRKNENE